MNFLSCGVTDIMIMLIRAVKANSNSLLSAEENFGIKQNSAQFFIWASVPSKPASSPGIFYRTYGIILLHWESESLLLIRGVGGQIAKYYFTTANITPFLYHHFFNFVTFVEFCLQFLSKWSILPNCEYFPNSPYICICPTTSHVNQR